MASVSPETHKEGEGGTLRLLVLLVNGLLPLGVIGYFCVATDHVLIGMLALHVIVMIALPVLTLKANLTPYYRMIVSDFRDSVQYMGKSILTFFGIIACGFALFVPLSCKTAALPKYCFDFSPFVDLLGPQSSKAVLIAAGLYFTIVNPIVEEWFWRMYLHKELGLHYLTPDSPPLTQQPDSIPSYGTLALIAETSKTQQTSFASKLIISTMYAVYHVLLLTTRISVLFGLIAWLFLTSLGLVLSYIRERIGISAAICVHAAVDAAVVVSLYYEKFG